ncbi:hypothetical protein [Saccharicrinis fermentans]|uniref:Uncharacterized protein n=1 Tax=Saccharicrinis fermentans DSM 9555 = JCM 21142 TaxID=869213 RepID=W7YDL6_9BACT|nr:hypothetical protein [Saccharicrinis fermentans]GAF05563.1 hypothetical protein JCM21142_104303 [Saccharicrinis fermentans DSM 9555 = JCM 21142]
MREYNTVNSLSKFNKEIDAIFLATILEKKGFVDTTKKHYPDHFKKLQEKGNYEPDNMKRCFSAGRLLVELNYINLYVRYNGSNIRAGGAIITKGDIASLLYFNSLQSSEKSYFTDNRVNPLHILKFLEEELSNDWIDKKSKPILEKHFNNIKQIEI